jgi:hypothetical protein
MIFSEELHTDLATEALDTPIQETTGQQIQGHARSLEVQQAPILGTPEVQPCWHSHLTPCNDNSRSTGGKTTPGRKF